MSHNFVRGKLPFKITSSLNNPGYQELIRTNFRSGYDIVNMHWDAYGSLETDTIQSPFTYTHVGGNQHRHVELNWGEHNDYNLSLIHI